MSYTITADHLKAIAGKSTPFMPELAKWMNKICPVYGIDTPQEFAHFIAQGCHETARFSTLREFGRDSYFAKYEGRKDLGNTYAGDGLKFKGRGIFQTTGRFNYKQLSIKKGDPDIFIKNPELLEQPENAVWSACEYWKTRFLNDAANHPDTDLLKKQIRVKGQRILKDLSPVEYISYTINGGSNGLEERKHFYATAKRVLV